MTEDEQAIRQVIETWMQATRDGDVGAVLSLMTEDAVFMVPGQPPFGREAFKQASSAIAGMHLEGANEIVEVQVQGEWAFSRNHIDLTMIPPSGEAVRRTGYTLTLYCKEADGRWRLMRDANLLAVKA